MGECKGMSATHVPTCHFCLLLAILTSAKRMPRVRVRVTLHPRLSSPCPTRVNSFPRSLQVSLGTGEGGGVLGVPGTRCRTQRESAELWVWGRSRTAVVTGSHRRVSCYTARRVLQSLQNIWLNYAGWCDSRDWEGERLGRGWG
ncbi:hypothetical protein HOY82DRAFT_222557 [Tuber indicum]|nr:hypothetical protein HOY82DRAFT_222557 [Tuber indicum]